MVALLYPGFCKLWVCHAWGVFFTCTLEDHAPVLPPSSQQEGSKGKGTTHELHMSLQLISYWPEPSHVVHLAAREAEMYHFYLRLPCV